MDTTMIVWICVATLMVALVMVKCIRSAIRRSRSMHRVHAVRHHTRLFEIGNEREQIWIPGDLPMSQQYDDDIRDSERYYL